MPIHSIAYPRYIIYTRRAYQLRTVCVAGLHQIIVSGTPAMLPWCSIRFLAMLFQAILCYSMLFQANPCYSIRFLARISSNSLLLLVAPSYFLVLHYDSWRCFSKLFHNIPATLPIPWCSEQFLATANDKRSVWEVLYGRSFGHDLGASAAIVQRLFCEQPLSE